MDSIRKKIAALLAKARGTDNMAEAAAFAAKAQELLAKHNLTESDVDPQAPGRTPHRKAPSWRGAVSMAAAHLFDVIVYRERDGTVVFAGGEGNRVTATLMHDYFVQSIQRAKRKYVAEVRAKVRAENPGITPYLVDLAVKTLTRNAVFERGAASELLARARAQHIADPKMLAIAEQSSPALGKARKNRFRGSATAFAAGRAAGGAIGINRQAPGASTLAIGRRP